MDLIIDSFIVAVGLIISGDRDVLTITIRTLLIAICSTSIAAIIFVPIGGFIHIQDFPGKDWLIYIINTLFSVPTVFVGLVVFMTFSKTGPLGIFDILFTPSAIIIGHVLLIWPIITGLTISALAGVHSDIRDTAVSLGANKWQTMLITLEEARSGISTALLLGFGRAISEIGLAIIVGGNIRGHTRTLTTAMSIETTTGNFELALALGMVLVCLALGINILAGKYQWR